jgi:hypothetical protein
MIAQTIPSVFVKKEFNPMAYPQIKTRECFFSGYIPFYLLIAKFIPE